MGARRLAIRQLLAVIGLVALFSIEGHANQRVCPALFEASRVTDFSQIPVKAEVVETPSKEGKLKKEKDAREKIAEYNRADLEDSQQFLRNLQDLSRRLGMRPEQV